MSIKLRELLKDTYNGKIVLPDFQRSFVWGPEDVRELLVSVFGGYFIGSMLFLESTRDEAPFALRLVEGVKKVNPDAKVQYSIKVLLDGQQRTTALFYAFYAPEIPLNGRKYPHRFYVDIQKALNGEWDDAIIGVSTADKRRLSEVKKNKYMVPVSEFKSLETLVERFGDVEDIPIRSLIKLYNSVMEYEIHVITLPSDTSLDKIVETFERLNKTGMPLSTFDLATARLYKYGINLRDMLNSAREQYEFVRFIPPEWILKVIALIRGKEPRRKNLLELDHGNFEEEWNRACEALELAYRRITDIRNGYGVLDFKKWAPYTTLIVPIAVMLDYLRNSHKESPTNYAKVDAFYWATVFGGRYDQAVDSKSFSDFMDFVEWVETGKVPEFIERFTVEDIDLDVSSMNSAIFKGVLSLIVLNGALDFKTGQPPQFELYRSKVQVDHIFPRSIYKEDRITNRTIITTNQSKSNKKPSEYFSERIQKLGREKVEEILRTHLIPPEGLDALLRDDIETFMELRKRAIIEEIGRRIRAGIK